MFCKNKPEINWDMITYRGLYKLRIVRACPKERYAFLSINENRF